MKVIRVVGVSRGASRFVSGVSRRRPLFPSRPPPRRLCRAAEDSSASELYNLQAKLEAAVESEDYTTAAELRDSISDLLLDVRIAVELANRQFYTAFENADLKEMRALWSTGDHVQCIHPMNNCISGHDLVMQSWETVFSTVPRGDYRIELEDVRVYVAGRMAYVTCTEMVYTGRDFGRIQATNVFELWSGKWTMVLHHGSPSKLI